MRCRCKKIVTGGVDAGTHFNPADIKTFDVKYDDVSRAYNPPHLVP